MRSDDADLVAAYWQRYHLSQGSRADRLRAPAAPSPSDEVDERISVDPVGALTLSDALLAAEVCDLHFFAAGPLEDLLVAHGAEVAQAVADRCAKSSRWRDALGAVWLDDAEWEAVERLHPWLPNRV
jgi:hypothetical protein